MVPTKAITIIKSTEAEGISSLFCKNGGPNKKISFIQEKQESGSVLRMTNALKVRIAPIYLSYS